jgi:hypothetical protein
MNMASSLQFVERVGVHQGGQREPESSVAGEGAAAVILDRPQRRAQR